MIISNPSTPASYFHLLRRQAYQRPRKPLVVMTPKSMLRLRAAASAPEDFTTGTFREVIGDDIAAAQGGGINRVVMCAGKVYHEIMAAKAKREDTATAVIRLEQFYPLAPDQLKEAVAPFEGAEIVWAQDEPENQGGWPFLALHLPEIFGQEVSVIARPASASPAVGTAKLHQLEQADLIERIFSPLN